MLSRIHVSAALLGLFLVGPAIAQGQSAPAHPTALIETDTLTIDTDFTVFMRRDVPDDLRRAALRRLWVLMRLPVSCDELCYEPQPAASDFVQLAGQQHPAAAE